MGEDGRNALIVGAGAGLSASLARKLAAGGETFLGSTDQARGARERKQVCPC